MKRATNSKETLKDNIPMTDRSKEEPAPKQPKPQEICRKIDHNSDWNDVDYGKGDQARGSPIDVQDP